VGLIGAASGYYVASSANGFPLKEINRGQLLRSIEVERRLDQVPDADAPVLKRTFLEDENGILESVPHAAGSQIAWGEFKFKTILPLRIINSENIEARPATGEGSLKFRRKSEPKGPMAVFGYDYFEAEWGKRGHTTKPKLLEYQGLWGGGEEYAYEVLNFADGKRNALEIRDAVSAEYGPVPVELVIEYLKALEEIGVVEKTEAKK
jgi:hypothetical protein